MKYLSYGLETTSDEFETLRKYSLQCVSMSYVIRKLGNLFMKKVRHRHTVTHLYQWIRYDNHLITAIKTFSLSDEYDANGTRRILQVLHAHTWPNLVMKG